MLIDPSCWAYFLLRTQLKKLQEPFVSNIYMCLSVVCCFSKELCIFLQGGKEQTDLSWAPNLFHMVTTDKHTCRHTKTCGPHVIHHPHRHTEPLVPADDRTHTSSSAPVSSSMHLSPIGDIYLSIKQSQFAKTPLPLKYKSKRNGEREKRDGRRDSTSEGEMKSR